MARADEFAEELALEELARALKRAILARGLRQSTIAAAIGVSPARVSQLLAGRGNPTIRTLGRIANAMDCDLRIVLRPRP